MKDLTKNYLTFCGVNTILYFSLFNKLYNKLKEDGYELVKHEKSIEDSAYFIIRMLIPIYNIATTTQIMLVLDNNEFYNIIKNRMLSRNIIKIKEDFINDNIEEPRKYTKIKKK